MFVHATHLPQRLAADDYSSPQFHQDELESMFLPGWHCIGTLAELKRDGDYFTTELLGRPLLCWRSGGEVRTFLNVCCHRFCMLTHEQHGSFRDRMKCQYHGWEYDTGGNPRKIPDAQSFRPLVKNQLQLTSYRTETVGQLVFVSLASAGPSLAEYLGDEMHRLCQDWFSTDQRHLKEFDSDVEANWKIVVENVLESYHIATVHAKSFTDYPKAEVCTHRFHEFGDECIMDYAHLGHKRFEEWAISKLAGAEPEYRWHHLIRYPSLIVARSCLVTYVQEVIPFGPGKCRSFFRAFHDHGRKGLIRSWFTDLCLKIGGRKFIATVLQEDERLYPHIQTGTSAPERPSKGLISSREERIFAFQEFVLQAVQRSKREPASMDNGENGKDTAKGPRRVRDERGQTSAQLSKS